VLKFDSVLASESASLASNSRKPKRTVVKFRFPPMGSQKNSNSRPPASRQALLFATKNSPVQENNKLQQLSVPQPTVTSPNSIKQNEQHEISSNTNFSDPIRARVDLIYKINPTLISITDTGLGSLLVAEDIEAVLRRI
jgi:hypothetical protein